MQDKKTLVEILSIAYAIAFLDGALGWGLAEGFYLLLGLVDIYCLFRLWVITHAE